MITSTFTADFGFWPPKVAIGNMVFEDLNVDGDRDSGEPRISDVDIQLFNAGDDPLTATPVATTTTVSGRYEFDQLDPGSYFVFIPPSEFQPGGTLEGYLSSPGNGNDETTDQNGDENGIDDADPATNGIASTIYDLQPNTERTGENQGNYTGILPDANVNFTADFGVYKPKVAIGNFVWEDTNNDGDFDAGETPIDGVVVQLFNAGDDPLTDTPVASTSTAGGGFYEFDQLDPGSYFVFIPPSEFGVGEPLEGLVSSTGNGNDETTDQNGDENGIDDANPATNGIRSTVYDLQPDSEVTGEDQSSYTGVLDDNHVNFTADFGFWPPKVAIGNFVWEDTNNDGNFDAGETPIDGVVVQLFNAGDDPLTDTPVASTSTAGGGFYEFDQLDPGSYFVFIPPSEFGVGEPLEGLVSSTGNGNDETTDQNGDENGIDDANPATNGIRSTVYDLQPDSEVTGEDQSSYTGVLDDNHVNFTADFGFWPPKVAIGNFVWEDTNNDGNFDAGETPIDGAVVQLFEDGDNPLTDTPVASTSTAGGGFYEFDQLDPGSYFVFIPPSEFGSGEPLEGYVSSTGNGADETTDQNGDENGIDDSDPATNGISSTVYDLQPDSEVTGEDQSSYTGTLDDDNVNFTADLAFYTEYDLALIKELAPGQSAVVNLGDPINYVLTVKNQGTVNSGEFTVEDTVPAGMIATSVSSIGFSDCQILNAGTLVRCVHSNDLAPGATVTINLTLLVTDASQTASVTGLRSLKTVVMTTTPHPTPTPVQTTVRAPVHHPTMKLTTTITSTWTNHPTTKMTTITKMSPSSSNTTSR